MTFSNVIARKLLLKSEGARGLVVSRGHAVVAFDDASWRYDNE